MGKRNLRHPFNLDEIILNCLQEEEVLTAMQIDAAAKRQCGSDQGCKLWVENTLRNHLDKLVKAGRIMYQEAGYRIDKGWKEGQPKAFILVELTIPKKPGVSHQKRFVEEITEGFDQQKWPGLYKLSVDVTMGAEFAVIVQVYSDNLHHIGRFVKDYLLTHELVAKTRTIMTWPTEPGDSASAK